MPKSGSLPLALLVLVAAATLASAASEPAVIPVSREVGTHATLLAGQSGSVTSRSEAEGAREPDATHPTAPPSRPAISVPAPTQAPTFLRCGCLLLRAPYPCPRPPVAMPAIACCVQPAAATATIACCGGIQPATPIACCVPPTPCCIKPPTGGAMPMCELKPAPA